MVSSDLLNPNRLREGQSAAIEGRHCHRAGALTQGDRAPFLGPNRAARSRPDLGSDAVDSVARRTGHLADIAGQHETGARPGDRERGERHCHGGGGTDSRARGVSSNDAKAVPHTVGQPGHEARPG